MTIYTLGIDPGLACTAWALAEHRPAVNTPHIIDAGIIKYSDPDRLARALTIAKHCQEIYELQPAVAVIIERAPAMYSTRPRGAADSDLNFLIGAIAYALDLNTPARISYVYPATWRTQVLGAANIQPDKATVCELFSVADPKRMLANADLRDAVCIAGWGARR